MPEPGLSEVLNMKVDPELGSGTPAVVIDHREAIRNLNQAAQTKAQYDWAKFQNFQKQLGDTLADVNKVQELDVMAEDRPALHEDRTKLFDLIYKNPGAFSGKDPEKFAEIQSMYGQLLGKATESKSFNAYDKAMRGYIAQNPELSTDENKAVIDAERSKKLGERKPYNISMPPIFDANAYTKDLLTQATEGPLKESTPVDFDKTGKEIVGDKYIKEISTTKVNYKTFIDKWDNSLLVQDDKGGKPIQKWAEKRYKELPESVRKNVTLDQYWHKLGEESFGNKDAKGVTQDILKKTEGELKANPNYIDPRELALKKGHLAVDWANYNRLAKGAKVSEQIANSAASYATNLYEKLNGLKDENGVISKDKLKNLTSDELKYLGSATTEDNKFTIKGLNYDNLTQLKVNDDGTIAVFENQSTGPAGKKVTTEVQRPSIEVKTIAINKLGDEMSQTTGKEGFNFNTLIPLYKTGKKEEEKAKPNIVEGYEVPAGATIVYSKTTKKPLGYTLNGKNYKF